MLAGGGALANTEKTAAMLLEEVAAQDPTERRGVAEELRKVAKGFAEVPDGG